MAQNAFVLTVQIIADEAHRPYILSTSDHFTLVLPDLTYAGGVKDDTLPQIAFVPVAHGTEHDEKILLFCCKSARKASEIAAYLGILDSSYFRKTMLENLAAQGYLKKTRSETRKHIPRIKQKCKKCSAVALCRKPFLPKNRPVSKSAIYTAARKYNLPRGLAIPCVPAQGAVRVPTCGYGRRRWMAPATERSSSFCFSGRTE